MYPSGGTRMPFVPVTVSRMKAAIVFGPSSWMTSSRLVEGLLGRVPAALDSVVRIHDAHHAGDAGLGRPAPRVAGQADCPCGSAVVRPVTGEDLVPSGDEPGQLDGVLVGLGAAVGEEEGVDVAGRELGQLRAEARARLGGHERVDVGQRLGLALDRLDHLRMAVADVRAHQLAVEVEEALALGGPEVDALGACHRDRVDLRLGRPLEEGVALGEGDHLVAGHGAALGLDRHRFSVSMLTGSSDYTTRRNLNRGRRLDPPWQR